MPELAEMKVLQKGNRLSITPVSENEYKAICAAGL
jgi:predicted RNA-binding protein with PUA-like domain